MSAATTPSPLTKESTVDATLSSLVSFTISTLASLALTNWILQRSDVALSGDVTTAQLCDIVRDILAQGTDPCSAKFFVELNAACGEEADYCEAVGDSDEYSWDALATWAAEVAPSFAARAPVSGVNNRRMTFAFTADKRGRPIAYYWGRGWRWFRAPYEASRLLVAQETAYTGNAGKRLDAVA